MNADSRNFEINFFYFKWTGCGTQEINPSEHGTLIPSIVTDYSIIMSICQNSVQNHEFLLMSLTVELLNN